MFQSIAKSPYKWFKKQMGKPPKSERTTPRFGSATQNQEEGSVSFFSLCYVVKVTIFRNNELLKIEETITQKINMF